MFMLAFFYIIIGSILGAPSSEDGIQIDKQIFDKANNALAIYDKKLDQVIPWNVFHQVISTLKEHQGSYSRESGALVGQIKTLLMNSETHYYSATQSIYNWCGESIPLLEAYLALFEDYNEEKADAQKTVLIEMLDSGITYMENALKFINMSSMSFNDASGKLEELKNQLNLDFEEKSAHLEEQKQKVRNGQWMAWASPIVGLVVTIVNEVDTIPKLEENIRQVKKFFVELKGQVDLAINTIDEAKKQLKTEIKIIGDLKSKTKTTKTFVPMDKLPAIRGILTKNVNELIKQCTDYRKRHGKA